VKTLLLVGATGLVGQYVLRLALADTRVARVIAPTRRVLPAHTKLYNPVVDFDHLPADADWWQADAVVCALGTTMAKAGSKEAFRRIDLELPLQVAKLSLIHGATSYALNSALGADAASSVFYSRTKGELEQALRAIKFPSLTLIRPGLLDGDRQESRPAERVAIWVSKAFGPLLPRRYRVVPAQRVAHHLLESALAGELGVKVLQSEQLL
jgi:uncharacterized protein YbjT (DUF2867 family)